jgi:RNA polymerase sigma factor (sigma-70 family)
MHSLRTQLRRLQRFLRLRGATREDAEDLVQEAMLRLHIYTNSGGDVRNPEGFVTRTAMNLAVDAHRRAHEDLYSSTPVEELTSIIDDAPRPEELLEAEERLRRMKDALDGVSRRTREVFFMHRLQGFSQAEIARRLGVTTSAIEKHIASAMTILAMERQKK